MSTIFYLQQCILSHLEGDQLRKIKKKFIDIHKYSTNEVQKFVYYTFHTFLEIKL